MVGLRRAAIMFFGVLITVLCGFALLVYWSDGGVIFTMVKALANEFKPGMLMDIAGRILLNPSVLAVFGFIIFVSIKRKFWKNFWGEFWKN